METIGSLTRRTDYKKIFDLNVVDIADFNDRVVGAYNDGTRRKGLAADDQVARSVIPGGTGALRDFSYIAPDIPVFITENCVGCMECVTQCPDTAILGKVIEPSVLEQQLSQIADEAEREAHGRAVGHDEQVLQRPREEGRWAAESSASSSTRRKCKGCAECVDACGDHDALKMIRKDDENLDWYKRACDVLSRPCRRRREVHQ